MELFRRHAVSEFAQSQFTVISNSQYVADSKSIAAVIGDISSMVFGSYIDSNLVAYQFQQLLLSLNTDRSILFLLKQTRFLELLEDVLNVIKSKNNIILRESFLHILQRLSVSSLPIVQIFLQNNVFWHILHVYGRVDYVERLLLIVSNFLEDAPGSLTPVLIDMISRAGLSQAQLQSLYVLTVYYDPAYTVDVLDSVRSALRHLEMIHGDTSKYLFLAAIELLHKNGPDALERMGITYRILRIFRARTRTFADISQLFVALYAVSGQADGYNEFLETCSDSEREEAFAALRDAELQLQ